MYPKAFPIVYCKWYMEYRNKLQHICMYVCTYLHSDCYDACIHFRSSNLCMCTWVTDNRRSISCYERSACDKMCCTSVENKRYLCTRGILKEHTLSINTSLLLIHSVISETTFFNRVKSI